MTEYTDNLNAAIDKLEVELAHQHDLADAMEKDVDRLRAGYVWLEELADKGFSMSRTEADGTIEISRGIHALYHHVDLADLCVQEAAEASRDEA